jgi:hypothetical protein
MARTRPANSTAGDALEFRGMEIKRPYGQGLKSAYEAVMLATPDGTYRLRRAGGHPFTDPELNGLVGQEIVLKGVLHQRTVIMQSWEAAR